ncbi:MAG: VOC family protein [Deltaproteobacteria bacterium]|nr:VOC family protein [Deltaproteobacteria bacterium]
MSTAFKGVAVFVRDAHRSREFYEDLLGQQVISAGDTRVTLAGGISFWQAGHATKSIFGREVMDDGGRLGRRNLQIRFETADLDALWERVGEAGATILHPIQEQAWGQRIFRLMDPDGHIVELAEGMDLAVRRLKSHGLSDQEIAKRTSIPVELVRKLAG